MIDVLAEKAGGYFSMPAKEDIEYTSLLFDISRRFGIDYYHAGKKERAFVDEVTRVTWAKNIEKATGVSQNIRPSFSA